MASQLFLAPSPKAGTEPLSPPNSTWEPQAPQTAPKPHFWSQARPSVAARPPTRLLWSGKQNWQRSEAPVDKVEPTRSVFWRGSISLIYKKGDVASPATQTPDASQVFREHLSCFPFLSPVVSYHSPAAAPTDLSRCFLIHTESTPPHPARCSDTKPSPAFQNTLALHTEPTVTNTWHRGTRNSVPMSVTLSSASA